MGSRFPLHQTKQVDVWDAQAVTGVSADIVCDGYGSLSFDVSGPTTVTINVYGSPDGVHWNLLCVLPMSATLSGPINQITGTGLCGTAVDALYAVRLTLVTLGEQETVTVVARLSTAAFYFPYCCLTLN